VSKFFCFLVATCAASLAFAQEQIIDPAVIDPTKPLHFSAAGVSPVGESETIQLTSILISSDRKIAIINGQVLGESQTVKGVGALVKKIDADAVTFQQNGKVWRVLLNNTAIRK
jgi:MSHA biogenesis protein MshK